STTVTIQDAAHSSAIATGTATISGEVSAQPVSFSPTEGAANTNINVATFTGLSGGSYLADINWCDGHITSGTILANGTNFTVQGTNTYGEDGSYLMTVTIRTGSTIKAVITNPVIVNDATLTGTGMALSPTQGVALNNVAVARFTDANP